jgi:hypothetical protein
MAAMEKFVTVLAGLFKGAVGKEENKMNLVPSIPKGSFGRGLVGRDGVPKRLVYLFTDHIVYVYINLFITSLCITYFVC